MREKKKMEIKQIGAVAVLLVMVSLIVGAGVLVLDVFATATAEVTTVTNESFTWPVNGTNVTLTHGNITAFRRITNLTTDEFDSNNYTVYNTEGNIEVLNNNSVCTDGDTCFAWYNYTEYDTDAKTALDAGRDAVGGIANSWMALIVTIVVLAIILTMVIRSFAGKR